MKMTIPVWIAGGMLISACARPEPPPVAVVNGVKITAAELRRIIPRPVAPGREDETRRQVLNDLIDQELAAQEAQRLGLDSVVGAQGDLVRRGTVIQEFFRQRAGPERKVTEAEIAATYRLLETEARVRVLSVPDESTARFVERELARGVPFETLAFRYSQDQSARFGGEIAPVLMVRFPEPIRSAVLALEPGRHTPAIPYGGAWEFVYLIDRLPADNPPPPLAEIRDRIRQQLESERLREVTSAMLESLRVNLRFGDALPVLLRPLDSITPAEQELVAAEYGAVATVKVGQLLPMKQRLPPGLDTATVLEGFRREARDIVLYAIALASGIDRQPPVRETLARLRRDVLANALREHVFQAQPEPTDAEVAVHYREHAADYGGAKLTPALKHQIRVRLTEDRRVQRYQELLAELHRRAAIAVDSAALSRVAVSDPGTEKPGR